MTDMNVDEHTTIARKQWKVKNIEQLELNYTKCNTTVLIYDEEQISCSDDGLSRSKRQQQYML